MSYVFKCKMCGGILEVKPGDTVCECEYCGAVQTLPHLNSDRKANLYDRANYLRRGNDFDRAMGVYEQILSEDKTDAEAYWSLVLCRYGIEYVEDPLSHKRIPTVNRAQYTSVFSDEDYLSALRYADDEQKKVYEAEAKAIDDIQKGILAISQKEEPFDIFICYKESDDSGRRTQDSLFAYEIYKQLTTEGYKVFFSRVTLEDKLGIAYEPYIFAALNSAKIMLVVGTRPEYFNAVWVKNEWSRYLALINKGAKKMLIPIYRDMNPYDLPDEFSHLQAQDMSRIGFMQDLVRGIHKILDIDKPKTSIKQSDSISRKPDTEPLLKRAFLFLEDGNFKEAAEYCKSVLDQDPENAMAYLGQLMIDLQVRKQSDLDKCLSSFSSNSNYQRAVRYGDAALKATLDDALEHVKANQEEKRKTDLYTEAVSLMDKARTVDSFQKAVIILKSIPGYRDADYLAEKCSRKLDELNEEDRQKAAARKKNTKMASITVVCIAIICMVVVAYFKIVVPKQKYSAALESMRNGELADAKVQFRKLGDYEDSSSYITIIDYIDNGQYEDAISLIGSLDNDADIDALLKYPYDKAIEYSTHTENILLMGKAMEIFGYLGSYSDAEARLNGLIEQCRSYGNIVVKSKPEESVGYYRAIPEAKRTFAEQNLVNLFDFRSRSMNNGGRGFFKVSFDKSSNTLSIIDSPDRISVVGLTVFKCDGNNLYLGKLTGQGEGIITCVVKSDDTYYSMNTSGKVNLYFPN